MSKVTDLKIYQCSVCGKKYTSLNDIERCEQSHDLVYVAIERADLKKLIQFIYSGEPKLLSESLVKTLLKYSNMKAE